MRQLVSHCRSHSLLTHHNSSLEKDIARHNETAVWFLGGNSNSAIMHVCHQQKRTIYSHATTQNSHFHRPNACRLITFLFASFFAFACQHTQLHEANEQFEMALWTLEMNEWMKAKNANKIYLWCMSFSCTSYKLQFINNNSDDDGNGSSGDNWAKAQFFWTSYFYRV